MCTDKPDSFVDKPDSFLRDAGVPETIIDSIRPLADHPVEYHTCFISYSSKDVDFAKQLYSDLKSMGIECWFAPKDLKAGEQFPDRIAESIRRCDKLVPILSKDSILSSWVETEVGIARERELQDHMRVLCPIRLDNTAQMSKQDWVKEISNERHIGDFTNWQQPDVYQSELAALLDALKMAL